jgi:aminopeptidase N
LSWFFDQWLRRPGMPRLKGSWRYDPSRRQIQVELAQAQTGPAFRLPIEVGIAGPKGLRIERIELSQATETFTIATDAEPSSVVLDPNTWVLMEPPEFAKRQ